MAFLERDEYFDRVKRIVGDRTDEDSIKFIEDFTETYDTLTDRADGGAAEDWKRKYEENDRAWSERYKERFFNGKVSGYKRTAVEEIDEDGNYAENITIENLFEKKETEE